MCRKTRSYNLRIWWLTKKRCGICEQHRCMFVTSRCVKPKAVIAAERRLHASGRSTTFPRSLCRDTTGPAAPPAQGGTLHEARGWRLSASAHSKHLVLADGSGRLTELPHRGRLVLARTDKTRWRRQNVRECQTCKVACNKESRTSGTGKRRETWGPKSTFARRGKMFPGEWVKSHIFETHFSRCSKRFSERIIFVVFDVEAPERHSEIHLSVHDPLVEIHASGPDLATSWASGVCSHTMLWNDP